MQEVYTAVLVGSGRASRVGCDSGAGPPATCVSCCGRGKVLHRRSLATSLPDVRASRFPIAEAAGRGADTTGAGADATLSGTLTQTDIY